MVGGGKGLLCFSTIKEIFEVSFNVVFFPLCHHLFLFPCSSFCLQFVCWRNWVVCAVECPTSGLRLLHSYSVVLIYFPDLHLFRKLEVRSGVPIRCKFDCFAAVFCQKYFISFGVYFLLHYTPDTHSISPFPFKRK